MRAYSKVSDDSPVFAENLRLLEGKNKDLHRCLAHHTPSGRCLDMPTPSGSPTLLYLTSDAGPRYLHSPQDPVGEAESLLSGYTFHGEDLTVLFGMGLGYLPLAIVERMHADHRLFIVEDDYDVLLKALHLKEFRKALSDNRIRVFHTSQLRDIYAALEKEQFRILGGKVGKLIYPPAHVLATDSYTLLENDIERFVVMLKNNYAVLDSHSSMTVKNILENVASLTDDSPVDCLFDLCKEKPAMVVAAGPSLDKNIEVIGKFKQHFVIISVDSALKPLLSANVRPDLVVSVDPILANKKKVNRISKDVLKKIPLVFSPYVYPEIPPLFTGSRFIFNEPNYMSRWALGKWRPVSTFPYGFSVSHYAFYLARAMGADPIVFTGLDLALTADNRSHAKNSADTWNIDNITIDLPRISDIYGKPVPTIEGFIHMITLFENEVSKTKALCIDATEGGAWIKGTHIMPLEDAIKEYAREAMDGIQPAIERRWKKNRLDRTTEVESSICWLKAEAASVIGICRKACAVLSVLLEDFENNRNDPTGVDSKIKIINRLSDQMARHAEYKDLIKDRIPRVLVNQFKNKYRFERMENPREKLFIELRQSHLFFTEIRSASEQIQETVNSILIGKHGLHPENS